MITAIVLAAGQSTRMGSKNKMFLPFMDSTVLSQVIAELIISNVDEIIVVMDNDTHANEIEVVSQVKLCINPNALSGLTSSIQTGVENAHPDSDLLICLGDMPLINSKEYNLLINKSINQNKKVIIRPYFNQKFGNPILFSRDYRREILELKFQHGCKPIVLANKENVLTVEMPSQSILLDIDTEEEYKTLLNHVS